MQVAENLLIGACQEDAQHIGLAVPELVELETRVPRLVADELVDLAVGVACHVLQRAAAHRLLVEPMDRHDREELIDRPAVGQRLEEREVAEVPIHHRRIEIGEDVFVVIAVLLHDAEDRVHRGVVHLLRHGAPAQ